jgi:hypothetical protein
MQVTAPHPPSRINRIRVIVFNRLDSSLNPNATAPWRFDVGESDALSAIVASIYVDWANLYRRQYSPYHLVKFVVAKQEKK